MPHRGIVHFHKVFKGFRPIGPALMVLVQRPLWGAHAKTQDFSIVFGDLRMQPVRTCGMLGFAWELISKVISRYLI